MKRILLFFCAFTAFLFCHLASAAGLFFDVSDSGDPANLEVSLCLNGKRPFSCQHYHFSALTLHIQPALRNQTYPAAGIKILTPGYKLNCVPNEHGYCLFYVSDTSPKTFTLTKKIKSHTVGGSLSGLTGTVALANNFVDVINLNTDGTFTFPTPIAEGSPYHVTIQSQPAGQSCTVTNGDGTMGTGNVTNVIVTCNDLVAYTVGGTVTFNVPFEVLTLELQDNGVPIENKQITGVGSFTFSSTIIDGHIYDVFISSPPAPPVACFINNSGGQINGANITNVDVYCDNQPPPQDYFVGGSATFDAPPPMPIDLELYVNFQPVPMDITSVDMTGPFQFGLPLMSGDHYEVTFSASNPPPPELSCTLQNEQGDIINQDITNIQLSCVTVGPLLPISKAELEVITPRKLQVISVAPAKETVLQIKNKGKGAATNVHAILPTGWSKVRQDASGCKFLKPGDSCQLKFKSTIPYVAQSISITGTNVRKPVESALAFSLQDNLVFGINSNHSALVIDNKQDAKLLSYQNALSACYQKIRDNSGHSISGGDWFLPTVCQLGGKNQAASCPQGLANIETNLYRLGFMSELKGAYWSKTEPESGVSLAWLVNFDRQAELIKNNQYVADKSAKFKHNCVREMSY